MILIVNNKFHLTIRLRDSLGYNKTESVESFVYLAIGIWRDPKTNKQYPTLVQYGVGTEYAEHIQIQE